VLCCAGDLLKEGHLAGVAGILEMAQKPQMHIV
jgi:hypothetical protein